MTYKTILVHCNDDRSAAARLELAASLAERHKAHLVGLHARQPFQPPALYDGSYGLDAFFNDHDAAVKANAATSAQAFAHATKGRSITTEWRSADGYAEDLLSLSARYADLTVVGQYDPDPKTNLALSSDLPESVALATGRGTLVVPFAGAPKTLGSKVMLCWNASRESARPQRKPCRFCRLRRPSPF